MYNVEISKNLNFNFDTQITILPLYSVYNKIHSNQCILSLIHCYIKLLSTISGYRNCSYVDRNLNLGLNTSIKKLRKPRWNSINLSEKSISKWNRIHLIETIRTKLTQYSPKWNGTYLNEALLIYLKNPYLIETVLNSNKQYSS